MDTSSTSTSSRLRAAASSVRVPSPHDHVYKHECLLSFDTPFSPAGLYTSLSTWQSFGRAHVDAHFAAHAHPLYLKQVWKRVLLPSPAPANHASAPSKMAIGVDGGFDLDKSPYRTHVSNFLVLLPHHLTVPIPDPSIPAQILSAVDAILLHDGFQRSTEVAAAWQEEDRKVSNYAHDLIQLPSSVKISPDPSTWRCAESGTTENLWLNLSTGHIGSGRRNWDGTGGTGAAQNHFEATGRKYPLVVKLGTITPQGADVFSYAPDEDDMVVDPLLSKHLAHWGINMQLQEKTVKTVTELQIELNANYNFSKITESGSNLTPLHGPGYVGLINLGNSCYMSSVMQIIFTMPEVASRFFDRAESIIASAPANPADDLITAMAKLAVGLLSDKYTKPLPLYEEDPQNNENLIISSQTVDEDYSSIKPFMFKNLIGKGHPEFSSGRQQDASEFFQYFLDKMNRAERIGRPRLMVDGETDAAYIPISALFTFEFEDRIQDSQTSKVKYMTRTDNILSLAIDVNDAVNKKQVDDFEENSWKRPKYEDGVEEVPVQLQIPFDACLKRFEGAEIVEHFTSPDTGKQGTASKRTRFKTFPEYLAVHLRRYFLDEQWMPKKLDASVPMPSELDLSHLRATGLQDGEVAFDEEMQGQAAESTPTIVPDTAIVSQLVSMGFSENGSKRAAIATKNQSAEASMEWVFAHMEDPDFNNPIDEGSSSNQAGGDAERTDYNPESVAMLVSMGFTETQAKAALKATEGSVERAGDWLFSHADGLDAAASEVLAAGDGKGSGSAGTGGEGVQSVDGVSKYELMGFASHLGKNTGCGHYVAHIQKDGRYVLFNDEKVAVSKRPPIDLGFLYVYRRKK